MKTAKIIINFLRITLVFAIIISIFHGSWSNLFISCLTIFLTFIPHLLEKKYQIDIPLDLEFFAIFFIYTSLFLGEVVKFYEHFWWWDAFLHTISAIAFSIIGFIILFILFQTSKIKGPPIWIAIFSFCFAVSIGVIWEIFEFSMDQIFGFNMQKSGLIDTMRDLITNCMGAALASIAGYMYTKSNKKSYLSKLIGLFIYKNTKIKL